MKRYTTVDDFIAGAEHWQPELIRLRQILVSTELEETVKWGAPCYTYDGKNVAGIGAFKSYFGIWFFQGALLADEQKVLMNCQQGKTKALRQWRMQSAKDIKPGTIKTYIKEAVRLQKQGKQIKADRSKPVTVPRELRDALAKNKQASASFKSLSKGLQREYADYVASAKRDETKQKRLEKILPLISKGAGLNDKYRKP